MRGAHIENYGYNFPSGYFMSMGVDKLLGLRYHGVFYAVSFVSAIKKEWPRKL